MTPVTTSATYPSLTGRTVLVSGGASGIGEAITRAFLRNGARVAVLDIAADAGAVLADEFGERLVFEHVDLTDIGALRAAVADAEQRLGPVQHLVNNASNDLRHEFDTLTPGEWDASQAVNLRHQFFVTQAVAPGMRTLPWGTVVNLSSTAWMWGAAPLVPYTTAKAAVIGLTRSLGVTLGRDNIRVNAVAPGAVMTERQMRLWYTPETAQRSIDRQLLQAAIVEDDIANAVLFLSADDSRMITKQCLTIEGGVR